MSKNNVQDYDLKEVAKLTSQLLTAALLIAIVNAVLTFLQGCLLSAISTTIFCLYLSLILLLQKKGYTRHTKLLSIIGFNSLITVLVLLEGLASGSYLYYVALVFAIPFTLDNNRRYTKEIILYITITALLFAICVCFCPQRSTLQVISENDLDSMFKTNSLSTITLCAVFAYLSIKFERKYVAALLQEKMKAEEATKAKTQFLSHMGHELRTPLNGIVGATNLLDKKTILKEQQEEFTVLKYCTTHMLELINNILDYNKIEAEKLELHLSSVNLKQIVHRTALPFFSRFNEKNISFEVDIDDQLNESVLVDDIRLAQVLNNLLSNAFKFTKAGSVTLRAFCEEQQAEGMRVLFSVEDTGIGIKKEDYDKVFDSFGQVYSETTRQYEGSGLGVTICQRLLHLMNSQLKMKTVYGQGSTFYCSILFSKADNKDLHKAPPNKELDLSGIRILLAEDNQINMMIARKTLAQWNIDVVGVENGLMAVQALASDPLFDVVILDLEMPVMDGYTAIKKIKEIHPDVPVLAFTAALIDREMHSALKKLGFEDAMLKPFQPTDLYNAICSCVEVTRRQQMQSA